jgi:hypothetical protein
LNGLERQKEPHIEGHVREDKELLKVFETRLISYPLPDYNKLRLTWNDVTFLWTRGIQVDSVEYDKNAAAAPCKDEGMSQGEWTRILRRAWPI